MSENPFDDNEAYSVTLKAGKDFQDPWLVIKAGTIEHLHDRVKAAHASGIMATIGNTAKSFQAAYRLGHVLDAEPINPPKEPEAPKEEAKEEKPAPKKRAPRKTAAQKQAEAEAAEASEKAAEPEQEEEAPEEPEEAPEEAVAAPKARPKAKWKR